VTSSSTALKQLDPGVQAQTGQLRDHFTNAEPFRHVVIDPLLRPEALQQLAREFPAFDAAHALNELGEVGGKAFRPDLPALGPAYAQFDHLLRSPEFLGLITEITGIPSLLYDPSYTGGGTHENLPGQDLDPHVDFNYHPSKGWHRRLNLILFLNPEWDVSWGGCLDLHRDPWTPEKDSVTSVVPRNNTCVLFETTEASWHGFRKVVAPPGQEDISRKSIAAYFYTRERPSQETAPSHATVYVPRPLPDSVAPGKVLTEIEVAELRTLLQRRDQQIRFLYEREQEYTGVLHSILYSPTFRAARVLGWPFRAVRNLIKGRDETATRT